MRLFPRHSIFRVCFDVKLQHNRVSIFNKASDHDSAIDVLMMFRWLIRFIAITVVSKLVSRYLGGRGERTLK